MSETQFSTKYLFSEKLKKYILDKSIVEPFFRRGGITPLLTNITFPSELCSFDNTYHSIRPQEILHNSICFVTFSTGANIFLITPLYLILDGENLISERHEKSCNIALQDYGKSCGFWKILKFQ